MRKILIATKNQGKLKEIRALLLDIPYELTTLEDIAFKKEVAEPGKDFTENAIIKAKTVGQLTKMLTLAEDSGLQIDALGGRPGVYSARLATTDKERIQKVLREMEGIPANKRNARYRAVVALYEPKTAKVYKFEAVSEGYIMERCKGDRGFGFDPIFYNFDLKQTNAEASLEEKNKVSHRARAFRKAKALLLKLLTEE